MRTILKTITTVIVIVLIVVVGVLAFAGFVPGLSRWVGADTPRDLGAPVASQDLDLAEAKLRQSFIPLSSIRTVGDILNGGSSAVETTLTGPEFAAHLQAIHPVTDLQIKFNSNDSFEASGRIDKTRLLNAVRLLGYTKLTDTDVLNAVSRYLPKGGAFYLRGKGAIVDNEVTLTIAEATIGRLPVVPSGFEEALKQYAKAMLEHVPGLSLKQMKVTNQTLWINGNVPKQLPAFSQ